MGFVRLDSSEGTKERKYTDVMRRETDGGGDVLPSVAEGHLDAILGLI